MLSLRLRPMAMWSRVKGKSVALCHFHLLSSNTFHKQFVSYTKHSHTHTPLFVLLYNDY